jgi:hypothetical protein
MGLLGDIYSWGDTQKRRLGGLLSNPLETLALGVRRFGEDQQGLLDAQANAYPLPGQNSVMVTPQQNALARALLGDQGAQMGMAAATVYHGSPHKFDKFDASKIGTGEGAQAYGHGLYLADSPKVAGEYSRRLSVGRGKFTIDGKPPNFDDFISNKPAYEALLVLEQSGDVSKAINSLKGWDKKDSASWLQSNASRINAESASNLYKVDLPDNAIAKMLDWDKPLSQQAPEVQKFAEDLVKPYKKLDGTGGYWAWIGGKQKFFDDKDQALKGVISEYTGADLYGAMGLSSKQGAVSSKPDAQSSDLLARQGIPGIRYLDGGSRGAGGGTSNYVVFPGNEGLLKILQRNGQDLP